MHRLSLFTIAPFALIAMTGGACPTGPTSYCEARARAQCHFLFNCCEGDELAYQFYEAEYAANEGECYDRLAPSCKTQAGGMDRSIALGRLRFNGDKASACANAASAAADACDPSLAYVVECGQVTIGLVEDGDECALSDECGNGGYCDDIEIGDPDVNDELGALEGKCVAPVPEGEDCGGEGDGPCERGLACVADTGGDATCEAPPEEGDDCANGRCAYGLFCNTDDECEARRNDGDDCDEDLGGAECKTGTCDGGTCGSGICEGR